MTQIASLLVVATVFTWLMICNVCILQSERWGGLYARQNYLCRNLGKKCSGGLMREGGGA